MAQIKQPVQARLRNAQPPSQFGLANAGGAELPIQLGRGSSRPLPMCSCTSVSNRAIAISRASFTGTGPHVTAK
jgi:hypothetical protein